MAEPVDEQTPQERDQPYDRWSRPEALSKRGYAIIAVLPFLIAAIAFGVVSLVSAGDETGSGTTVRLPVSGWTPGGGGDGAQIQGVLRLDDDHCVYLEAGQDGADPGQIWPVWPAGFKAVRDGERLTLLDGAGRTVAHDGDRVSMGGGYGPVGTFAGQPCLPESGEVAIVQSEVTVAD
ncbi:hypothetical protein [Nocardioides sp. T2.26MG-1]|uniref:hypothetical protein n=1 Tax=Nocardioides sp. T2.26MG-1 TaxID=3041166 RepID=UPI0024773898|nr:hypothetical protein [Nocardioides sp. T2.26MG-1]CAI9405535.1 hypothetical protein HIDPHFAB_04404 [Nocardioides sp. T2.26MG-1]